MQKIVSCCVFVMVASVCLMGTGSAFAQMAWVHTYGGGNHDHCMAAPVVDSQGYIYTAGAFNDTAAFSSSGGSISRIATAYQNICINKYDPAGNLVWVKTIGGKPGGRGYGIAYGLALDKRANIYITGQFADTLDFDPGSGISWQYTTGQSDYNIFVLKLDANGDFDWVKTIGSMANSENGIAVTADPAGDYIYVGGYFGGMVNFNPGGALLNLVSQSTANAFLWKMDVHGQVQWAQRYGVDAFNDIVSLAADLSGNVYALMNFNGTVNFNPRGQTETRSSNGGRDVAVMKTDSSGRLIWVAHFGSTDHESAQEITFTPSGNLYLTGAFRGTVSFPASSGAAPLTTNGSDDVFVIRMDTSGVFKWVRSLGGSHAASDIGYGIAVDAGERVYCTGVFNGYVDFNPGNMPAFAATARKNDAFITKYDSSGNFLWGHAFGSAGDDLGIGITPDKRGNVYATGMFHDTVYFDPAGGNIHRGISSGLRDAYLFRITCNDAPATQVHATTCGDSYTLNDFTYTQGGIYEQRFPSANAYGCDSLVVLHLVMAPDLDVEIVVKGDTLGTLLPYAAYRWLLNGDTISGAVYDTHIAAANGDYQVVVWDVEECVDTSDVYSINNLFINDRDKTNPRMGIYPNPVSDILYISFSSPAVVSVVGIDGKIWKVVPASAAIRVSDLPDGAYFLQIRDVLSGRTVYEKFVKRIMLPY